jgi:Tfp pilus assembly protein PilN
MIEINLVPDVKQELLKAQRTRAVVISASIITSIAAIGLVVLLLVYIFGVQLVRSAVLDQQITDKSEELSDVQDLSKILTIQNQLSKISQYNDQKHMQSRIFDTLAAITPPEPNQVSFSNITVTTAAGQDEEADDTVGTESETEASSEVNDTEVVEEEGDGAATNTGGTLVLEGQTRSFDALEIFKKTVSNTLIQYTEDGETKTVNLAKNISTTDVSYGEDDSGQKVLRFIMTFEYAPELMTSKIKTVSYKTSINGNVTDSYLGIPRFTQRADDIEGNQ